MRTGVRRFVVGAALLVASVPLCPSSSAAAPPAVFEVLTTGVGMSVTSTQRPAASVITGGLVDATLGYSSSALSSAGASASAAAAFYPGDLIATGPSLLCSQFLPCPFTPPAYPLLAQASYPERPTGSAELPVPAGSAHALARESTTDGTAALWSASAAGAPVQVSVGSSSVTTRCWVDDAGAHVRSRSVLHEVVVGALHVASLDATDDVDVPIAGGATDRPHLAIAGVTLAGRAASIDEHGITMLGAHQEAGAPAIAGPGVEVHAVGVERADAVGAARSTAGGLRVTFTVPVSGVPAVVPGAPGVNRAYLGSVLIGGVGAAVGAGSAGDLPLAGLPAPESSSLAATLLSARRLGPGILPAHAIPAAVPGSTPPSVAVATRFRRLLSQADLAALALAMAVVPSVGLLLWRTLVLVRRRPR